MPNWTDYTQKQQPSDNDFIMIEDVDANANKRLQFSGLADWIVEKLKKNNVISGALKFKGSSAYAALPESPEVNDYYYCPDGDETNGAGYYAWNGTVWIFIGNNDKGIDNTLTVEGAAADAKAVGDKFAKVNEETNSLKEDLDNKIITHKGKNLWFNPMSLNPNFYPNKNRDKTSYAVFESSNNNLYGFVVAPNTTYTLSFAFDNKVVGPSDIYMYYGTGHDAVAGAKIFSISDGAYGQAINSSYTFTTDDLTTYVEFEGRISYYLSNDTILRQLEVGNAATEYEKYRVYYSFSDSDYALKKDIVKSDVSLCKDFRIDGINDISTEEITVSDESGTAPTDIYERSFSDGSYNGVITSSSKLILGTNYPQSLCLHQQESKPYDIAFYTNGAKIAIKQYCNGIAFTLVVNDKVVDTYIPSNDGNIRWRTFTFKDNAVRKIQLYSRGNMFINGIGSDNGLYSANKRLYTAYFDGDSITEGGASTNEQLYSYGGIVSRIMNWNFVNCGVGGTGFVATNNKTTIGERFTAIENAQPDVFVVCCGLNDESSDLGAVKSAVDSYYANAKEKLPNTKIFGISPFNPQTSVPDARKTITGYIKNACKNNAIPFIDIVNNITYDETGKELARFNPIITSINISTAIDTDHTHPVKKGAELLGCVVAREIKRIIDN